MDKNYWSVPILSQNAIDLPGKYGQRIQRTTTIYNVGDRRHHTLAVRWFSPGILLRFVLMVLIFFPLTYMFTFFVPGILLAITKDESLSWVFAAWAVVSLIIATLISRKGLLEKIMTRHALKERGLSANTKIAIVPDGKWDRWAARLK
jgi:hypothetical protein